MPVSTRAMSAVPKSEVTVTRAMAYRSSSAWLKALRTAVAERYPAAMTSSLVARLW